MPSPADPIEASPVAAWSRHLQQVLRETAGLPMSALSVCLRQAGDRARTPR